MRKQIAEMIVARLVELVRSEKLTVANVARACNVHATTALCYVQGEALPKADKFAGLIALIDSIKS
jgi:coenzyme F420-reducing hydrogenase beta subunit